MVGLGVLMLLVGVYGLYLYWRGRLYTTAWFHKLCMAMTPAGFLAVLAGWITAEVGRQPYVVYGLMRTANAASPVAAPSVMVSLISFMLVYGVVFGAGTYYLLKLIRQGPATAEAETATVFKTAARPLSLPDEAIGSLE